LRNSCENFLEKAESLAGLAGNKAIKLRESVFFTFFMAELMLAGTTQAPNANACVKKD
jgi:hypothetical protein